MRPIRSHIAYLKAGWTADIPSIPAISPYLRHGCMAGYPYRMPTASALRARLCRSAKNLRTFSLTKSNKHEKMIFFLFSFVFSCFIEAREAVNNSRKLTMQTTANTKMRNKMKKAFLAFATLAMMTACNQNKQTAAQPAEESSKIENEVVASAADTLSAEALKANMEEVQAYLKDCGAFALATVDGDQPRVRIFGVSEIIDGKLYIMTGKVKDVYKQIAKNGKFEICALKKSGAEWMRLSGVLVNDETLSVKEEFLNRNEGLKSMYKADDDNMAVLQITNATARFCSFSAPERKVGF